MKGFEGNLIPGRVIVKLARKTYRYGCGQGIHLKLFFRDLIFRSSTLERSIFTETTVCKVNLDPHNCYTGP